MRRMPCWTAVGDGSHRLLFLPCRAVQPWRRNVPGVRVWGGAQSKSERMRRLLSWIHIILRIDVHSLRRGPGVQHYSHILYRVPCRVLQPFTGRDVLRLPIWSGVQCIEDGLPSMPECPCQSRRRYVSAVSCRSGAGLQSIVLCVLRTWVHFGIRRSVSCMCRRSGGEHGQDRMRPMCLWLY